ncbi:TPA: acylphosphatase [Candidatus Bathyarchaeota archaeon]|nr:acylphosphatase [Candidatus Bathyarchaeota archaeon]HIJ08578.1 acylphosphatase [Candidatus Bathyarchaeota archaeon]
MKIKAHLVVEGRVQGVFFRSRTKREAEAVDVKGWVINRSDGQVETVFEGEEPAVKKMIEFCKRGPPGAKVVKVSISLGDYTGEFSEFEIRY